MESNGIEAELSRERMKTFRIAGLSLRAVAIAAPFSLACPCATAAEEHANVLSAIAQPGMGTPKFAGQFQLRLQLGDGRLARALLDVGVKQEDAAAAAKLAAGHLGMGAGGCQALVSIERNPGGTYSLMRVQLTTDSRRAIIEWRGSELVLASDTEIGKSPAVA